MVLKDEGASRRHAQLRTASGVTTITDLGSTNGTRVNGDTIGSRQLHDGDKITIGTTVLEFRPGTGQERQETGRKPASLHGRLLAEGITPFALSALKYGLFALLVLFLWRSMRWAVRGLSMEQASSREDAPRESDSRREGGPRSRAGLSNVVIHADGDKPRTVPVESTSLVLGRAPECELPLDDTYVSQQHARIFAKDGHWYVEDLGSTNGTSVNDQRLAAPARVATGRSHLAGHDRRGAAPMRIEVGVATDIGRVREGNEDSYLVEPPLYAVADGMGGHKGGEVASHLALDTIEELFHRDEGTLAQQVKQANRAVFERSQEDSAVHRHGHHPDRRRCRKAASSGWPTSGTAAPT